MSSERKSAHAAPVRSAGKATTDKIESSKNYKGFVAGVFSGIAKLSGKSLTLVNTTCIAQPANLL